MFGLSSPAAYPWQRSKPKNALPICTIPGSVPSHWMASKWMHHHWGQLGQRACAVAAGFWFKRPPGCREPQLPHIQQRRVFDVVDDVRWGGLAGAHGRLVDQPRVAPEAPSAPSSAAPTWAPPGVGCPAWVARPRGAVGPAHLVSWRRREVVVVVPG
jgi:hypothetical protein